MIHDNQIEMMMQGNHGTISIEEQVIIQHEQMINTDLQHQQLTFQQNQLTQHLLQLQQQLPQQHVLQTSNALYQSNNAQLAATTTSNVFMAIDEPSTSSANDVKPDATVYDVANVSDASTVEDSINEHEITNAEDAFTYLQGLNSDNLMQFSQQSALQEMMVNESLDIKPNLNILPTFEEHDIGGYKFQINVCNQHKGKLNWVYSEALNKVYIRMNELFNVEASYTPKLPMQKLRIRALLCFVKEVSEPVLRCQNHLSVDIEGNAIIRRSFLRCENPSAEYRGMTQGKNINDRLSILIPLNCTAKSFAADSAQKQTIAFKFTCQNSCIGRKETSIIFFLESSNGEILSQRVIDVKICSCPKRDKSMDERNLKVPKRKVEEDLYPRQRKVRKQEAKTNYANIKTESSTESDQDENSNDSNSVKPFDIQRTPSGDFRMVVEAPKDVLLNMLETGYMKLSWLIMQNTNHSARLRRSYRKIFKLHEKFAK